MSWQTRYSIGCQHGLILEQTVLVVTVLTFVADGKAQLREYAMAYKNSKLQETRLISDCIESIQQKI